MFKNDIAITYTVRPVTLRPVESPFSLLSIQRLVLPCHVRVPFQSPLSLPPIQSLLLP